MHMTPVRKRNNWLWKYEHFSCKIKYIRTCKYSQ